MTVSLQKAFWRFAEHRLVDIDRDHAIGRFFARVHAAHEDVSVRRPAVLRQQRCRRVAFGNLMISGEMSRANFTSRSCIWFARCLMPKAAIWNVSCAILVHLTGPRCGKRVPVLRKGRDLGGVFSPSLQCRRGASAPWSFAAAEQRVGLFCARAASGHAAATPPISLMNARRRMIAPRIRTRQFIRLNPILERQTNALANMVGDCPRRSGSMSSGLPLKPDIMQCNWHVSKLPTGDSCTAAI